MSYQLALCSRVVRTGNIIPVLNYGITHDDFTSPEARSFWDLVLAYYTRGESRGSVLGAGTLQTWYKNLVLADDLPSLTVETLCYEVRRERVLVQSNAALVRYADEVNIPTCNPAVSLSSLHASITELIALGTTGNSDMPAHIGLANLLQNIELAKAGANTAVMPWPWEPLQRGTFGVQPSDYVVFYGRPKSMKTWVLCALAAHAFEHEKKILIYTKEMTPDNIYQRTLACICRIYYEDLRSAMSASGKALSEDDMQKLENLRQLMKDDSRIGNLITVLSGRDVAGGGDTVSWLGGKIEKLQPDMLFVDGMYLLADQRKAKADHERVRGISRDLRALALDSKVPIIATMQANRKAAGHADANLDEIAYSDAIGQDITVGARVIADKHLPFINLLMAGNREFKLHGFRINGTPAKDFSFHSELSEKDIEKVREADLDPNEKAKTTALKTSKTGKKKKDDDSTDADLAKQMSRAAAAGAFSEPS